VSINVEGVPAPVPTDVLPSAATLGFTVATHSIEASSFINTDVDATAPALSFTPINASANNNVNVVNTLPALVLSGLNHTIVGSPETQNTDVFASAPTLSISGAGSAIIGTENPPYLPVVPGVFIFGSNQGGGRGGTVRRVTNLNNSGTGSFRAAMEAGGPTVIIFETSGIITLTSDVKNTGGNLTVAGQTAPYPGIMVRGATTIFEGDNTLVQHMRFRAGDNDNLPNPGDADSTRIRTRSNSYLFDHCTFGWGVDEVVGGWGPLTDLGFSNCIIHEGFAGNDLHPQSHTNNRVSNGLLIGNTTGGDGPVNTALVRCLFTHNYDRNPFTQGDECYIANNYVYNYKRNALVHRGARENDPDLTIDLSIVNNYYKRGPNSNTVDPLRIKFLTNSSRVYVSGNDISWGTVNDQWDIVSISEASEGNVRVSTDFVAPDGYVPLSPAATPQHVLDNAGARPLERDPPEDRNVADAINGTGSISSEIEQSGSPGGWGPVPNGWPTSWYDNPNTVTHTLPANPNADSGNGYTNLEVWLQGFAEAIEP
jgi:hypothetical protein